MNIEKYDALAKLNGLRFNRHGETSAVEQFAAAMITAADRYMDDPIGTPLLSAWNRITSAEKDFGHRMVEIIDEENKAG
jgi:glucosyl-3-phosphoglycerate synthase